MTQDEVLDLVRAADGQVTMWVNHSTIQKTTTFTFKSPLDYSVSGEYPEEYHIKFLEAFANLVAAKNKERILQLIKELRPAIKPLEGMGKGKTTNEWFDILVQDIEEKL